MRRLNTKPLVTFSTEHTWLIILISISITVLLLIPMRNLKIEPDVKSLLPKSIKESMTGNTPEQSVDYDTLAIMFSGDNLYTVEGLQLFDKTIEQITKALSAKKVIEPFSQTILEKTGSRLNIVTLSPDGKAPKTEEEVKIFTKRLKESPFVEGLVTSSSKDVLASYFFIHKGKDYIEMMETVHSITDLIGSGFKVTITGTMPYSAEIEQFLTKDFFKLLTHQVQYVLLS